MRNRSINLKVEISLLLIFLLMWSCSPVKKSTGSNFPTMIAHFSFDNLNEVQLYGASFVKDRNGVENRAVEFDGKDDYLLLRNNLSLKKNFPVTIAAWIKLKSKTPAGIFVNDFHNTKYYGLELFTNYYTQLAARTGNGGAIGPHSRYEKNGESILKLNKWYHVAVVFLNKTHFELYVNGKNDGGRYSGTGFGIAYSDFGQAEVGKHDSQQHEPPYFSHFIIDDLKVFNVALSDKEIFELYISEK